MRSIPVFRQLRTWLNKVEGPEEFSYLIVFESTHHALKAESFFEENDIESNLAAKPRSISSDCGLALFFDKNQFDRAVELLDSLKYKSIYKIDKNDIALIEPCRSVNTSGSTER